MPEYQLTVTVENGMPEAQKRMLDTDEFSQLKTMEYPTISIFAGQSGKKIYEKTLQDYSGSVLFSLPEGRYSIFASALTYEAAGSVDLCKDTELTMKTRISDAVKGISII